MTSGRAVLLGGLRESTLREHVREVAERHQWTVYWTWNSRNSPAGFPDLVMVRPPRLLIVELKTQGAPSPRGRQALWLGLLAQVPCVEVHIWRPLDEDAIQAALA